MRVDSEIQFPSDHKPSSYFYSTSTRTTRDQRAPESTSWSMEMSRWRVRLHRLKRWSRYEGRASDGQFNTSELPEAERLRSGSQPARKRHSLTSAENVRFDPSRFANYRQQQPQQQQQVQQPYYCHQELVVPPVCIPTIYRQQDKQRGVRVGGDRVPFTLDGHMRRRKMVRPLTRIEESEPLEMLALPDMRNSMAGVYALRGQRSRSRSRRAASV